MKLDAGDYDQTVRVKRAIQALDRLRKLAFKTGFKDQLNDQTPGGVARCCAGWLTMNDIPNHCHAAIVELELEGECLLLEIAPTPTKNSYLKTKPGCRTIVIRSLAQFLNWFDNNF